MFLLDKRIRNFPRHHTTVPFQLTHFNKGLSIFFKNKNKRKGKNSEKGLAMLTGCTEAYKLPGMAMELLLSLGTTQDTAVLPCTKKWSVDNNIADTSNVTEVCINALSSILEVVFFTKSFCVTDSGLTTFELLVDNARSHLEILYNVRNALEHKSKYMSNRKNLVFQEFVSTLFPGMKNHTLCHWIRIFVKLG